MGGALGRGLVRGRWLMVGLLERREVVGDVNRCHGHQGSTALRTGRCIVLD